MISRRTFGVVTCCLVAVLVATTAAAEASTALDTERCREYVRDERQRMPLPSEVRRYCSRAVVGAFLRAVPPTMVQRLARSDSKKCLRDGIACTFATVRALALASVSGNGDRAETDADLKPNMAVFAAVTDAPAPIPLVPVAAPLEAEIAVVSGVAPAVIDTAAKSTVTPAGTSTLDIAPAATSDAVSISSPAIQPKLPVDSKEPATRKPPSSMADDDRRHADVLDCPALVRDERRALEQLRAAERRLSNVDRRWDGMLPGIDAALDVAEALSDFAVTAPREVWMGIAAVVMCWAVAEWSLSRGGLRGIRLRNPSSPASHHAALASLRRWMDAACTAELIGPRLRVAGAVIHIAAICCSLTATVRALNGSFGGIIGLAVRAVSFGHDAFAVQAIVTVIFVLLFFGSVWQLGGAWRAWNGRTAVFLAVDHARGYLDR